MSIALDPAGTPSTTARHHRDSALVCRIPTRLGVDAGPEVIKREPAAPAEHEGFALEQMFVEQAQASEPAFNCLTAVLRGSAVRNMIVPPLWHFAPPAGLQKATRDHIETEIGARVWTVQGTQP